MNMMMILKNQKIKWRNKKIKVKLKLKIKKVIMNQQ